MQALDREVRALKELFGQRIQAIEDAVEVAHENLVRVPTETDKAIQHVREVFEERFATVAERFAGVQVQFRERDVRVEQTARASKEALDAALQAAKEAVGKQNDSFVTSISKSEAATNKQLEQLGALITTTSGATNSKVDDLKERIQRLEGDDRGHLAVSSSRQQWGQSSMAVISLVLFGGLSFLGLVVSVAAHVWGK